MSSAASLVESAKKAAAFQAVDEHLLPEHRFVGIGSGSTVVYVVDAIPVQGPHRAAAGLTLSNLDERPVVDGKSVPLDVAFDGADEVDEDLNLIKGGGACLFQEKLVAIAAKKFIAVADYRKQSPRLCTKWLTIPIEVLPLSAPDVLTRLQAMGSPKPAVRSGLPSKAGDPSEEGAGKNAGKWEVSRLAQELLKVPGIVEIGLFHGFNGNQAVSLGQVGQAQKPVAAYFGTADGSVDVQLAA
uniref:Ribose-5-phosphate isomerase n=1 Tax=Bionectria ochroleuca TaxID=29856 RepID=A0A8H7N6U5_BIOOC